MLFAIRLLAMVYKSAHCEDLTISLLWYSNQNEGFHRSGCPGLCRPSFCPHLAREQRSMVRAKAGAAQARATKTMKAFMIPIETDAERESGQCFYRAVLSQQAHPHNVTISRAPNYFPYRKCTRDV